MGAAQRVLGHRSGMGASPVHASLSPLGPAPIPPAPRGGKPTRMGEMRRAHATAFGGIHTRLPSTVLLVGKASIIGPGGGGGAPRGLPPLEQSPAQPCSQGDQKGPLGGTTLHPPAMGQCAPEPTPLRPILSGEPNVGDCGRIRLDRGHPGQ